MRNVLLILILFHISGVAFAQTKYRIHWCEKNIKCIDDKSVTLSFRVEPSTNKVLFQIYEKNKILKTLIRDDCAVFDSLNWHCKTYFNGLTFDEYRMENGSLSYNAPGLKDVKFIWTERL